MTKRFEIALVRRIGFRRPKAKNCGNDLLILHQTLIRKANRSERLTGVRIGVLYVFH